MSLLIEEDQLFPPELSMLQPLQKHLTSIQIQDRIISSIQNVLGQGVNLKVRGSVTKQSTLKVETYFKLSEGGAEILLLIDINFKCNTFFLRASFCKGQKYIIVQSNQRRKEISRKFVKMNKQMNSIEYKLVCDLHNGKIILLSALQQTQIFDQSRQTIRIKVKKQICSLFEAVSSIYFKVILILDRQKGLLKLSKFNNQQYEKQKQQWLYFSKVSKQLEVSHINFGFSSKADESSFPQMEKTIKQQNKLKDIIMNACNNFHEFKTRKLYQLGIQKMLDIESQKISYEVQHAQAALYSSYLKAPVPREPARGQNKYIFNQIKILNPQKLDFQPLSSAKGRNELYFTRLRFSYQRSHNYQCKELHNEDSQQMAQLYRQCYQTNTQNKKIQQIQHQNLLTKYIIAKPMTKNKNLSSQQLLYAQNQKNAIKQFRSGVSAYILKYYVSRQSSFKFKDELLMDYIPNAQPLSVYMELNSFTTSLHSKIYLLVNIANSLRFIKDYQIVHMDLSPNNVLVCKDLLIKLIDFGEAYSPNIPRSSQIKRGYTFPFTSPQFFSKNHKFTIKHDIFCFAIMFYRLVFDQYPFFPSKKFEKTFKKKQYENKIFLAPERAKAYGNLQTMLLFYRFFFKNLNINQELRSQPSWITIILKILYLHLL